MRYVPLEQRFWQKVHIPTEEANACWEWIGSLDSHGYGQLKGVGRSTVLAHRLSYQLNIGEIGDSHVLHKCDNGRCVNPSHLFLGTPSDNMFDMYAKKRHPVFSGETNANAKLTSDSVAEIRKLFSSGGYTKVKLGKMFGVSDCMVGLIVRNKFWKGESCHTA